MSFRNNPKLKGLKILKPKDAWDQYKQNNQHLNNHINNPIKYATNVSNGSCYKYQKLPEISASIYYKYPALAYKLKTRHFRLSNIMEFKILN